MKKFLPHTMLILMLIGCSKKEKLNFSTTVDKKNNIESHHLLSMFESANYELLNENDSLFSLYLNDSEIEVAKLNFDSTKKSRARYRHQYHLIEKRKHNNVTLLFLGRSIIGNGRNYTILFRVIDRENNIISTVTVATWNESSNHFYGCEILDSWSKIRHVYDGHIIREFEIDAEWQIKETTSNKYRN